MPRADVGRHCVYECSRGLGVPQRSEVSRLLHQVDKDLNDYAQEISSLESQLVFLRLQQERLQAHKITLSSLLSPIHHLPNEILLRIFLFACRENDLLAFQPPASSIAGVCHRWRELAMSCPALWSSFRVWLGGAKSQDSALATRLELFLKRSRDQPLTLHIECPDSGHPLLTKLVQHSGSWRHLTFGRYAIEAEVLGALPSLESLSWDTDSDESIKFELIPPLPNKLRRISTRSRLPNVTDLNSPPPVNQVTSLTFSPGHRDLFKPLLWFPNLQHLALGHCSFPYLSLGDHSPRLVPITSLQIEDRSKLNSLTWTQATLVMLEAAMDLLMAPNLSSLVVNNDNQKDPDSFSHIQTFIERSGCVLTVLELRGLAISDTCVVDLLRCLHSLAQLTLEDSTVGIASFKPPISKKLIDSLHTCRSSPLKLTLHPIIPRLRSLAFRAQSRNFNAFSFIDMVSSRWIPDLKYAEETGISCLRSIELHLCEPVNEEDYSRLWHLENSGMRVVVKGKDT
ncbi:hypothetical protein GYMLUDRAFT_84218 [Collybiopsis luxurians FD-317 M1]|uniref:F-box domain-containing protein n=1 Tax=Collybiopsis luxurians FD-317 M1 TaxID=944289 RepID=A0A0D0BFP1_9AGAR|nr:hypothetical protein GYMLUDRAFT_84218 [Collybiopsis luxurians FD-317 M1]